MAEYDPSFRSAVLVWEEANYRRMVAEFPDRLCAAIISEGRPFYRWVSRGAAAVLGYPAEELEHSPSLWLDIVHPIDRPRIVLALERIGPGQSIAEEYRIFRQDGQMRWIREDGVAARSAPGGIIRLLEFVTDITERKRSEEAHAVQEALLRQFLECVPAAVAVFDNDMRYILMSERWLIDYELGDQDIVGRTHYEVFPDIPERWKEIHRRVLAGATESCREDRWERDDGSIDWVRWELRPWHGADGEIGGLVMFTEVITERKETELALQESEELLRAIQDALPANLAVLDSKGTIIAVNEGWERFARENGDPDLSHTGVGVNYLEACRRAYGPRSEGAKEALEGLQAMLQGEMDEFELEYPCPAPRRPDAWYYLRAAPLRRRGGGLVASHVDISRIKQAERALRESEERYRTLVDNTDAAMFRLDPDLRMVMLAGRSELSIGCPAEQLTGDPDLWRTMVHPQDVQKVMSKLSEALTTGERATLEFRVISMTGQVQWVRAHAVPRYDHSGTLTHIDGVALNISERMEAIQREERHSALMAALADISEAFGSSLDVDEIIATSASKISKVLNCICSVLTVEPGTGHLVCLRSFRPDGREEVWLHELAGELGLTPETAFGTADIGPGLRADVAQASPQAAEFAARADVGPGVVVPIAAEQDQVVRILSGLRHRGEPEFDEEDFWFFTEVASHASAALTRAALYKRQANIAETLQRSLIPASPRVEGLDIATSYSPASADVGVGGDFFDIVEFNGGLVGVVVGDVSGKGMDAAVYTAAAKYMLRGFAHQEPHPEFVINTLNSALCRYMGEFAFVTLVYLVIDRASHRLTFVNAGHETPLILCTRGRTIRELRTGGPVLGMIGDHTYSAASAVFEPDDLLFCYTDGVVDVRNNGGRFGYARLLDTAKEAPGETSQQFLDHITRVTGEFSRGAQFDDQAIVVVKLSG